MKTAPYEGRTVLPEAVLKRSDGLAEAPCVWSGGKGFTLTKKIQSVEEKAGKAFPT